MTTETKKITYELHHTGHIFVVSHSEFSNDAGKVIGQGQPHRTPIAPVIRIGDAAVETELDAYPEALRQLAAIWWTPEIVGEHRARLEAAIAAELAARKAAAKGKASAKG